MALHEHLLSDGWRESRLEPALFYLRISGRLQGFLVSHVDDLEGGVKDEHMEKAFAKSSMALELKQHDTGHIDVTMRNYALSMKPVPVARERRQHLTKKLNAEEENTMMRVAGELGWLTRQLRCDLAYESGCVQRCKSDACVADYIKMKQYVGQARQGADFRRRYWSDVSLADGVLVHLADSGHANGTRSITSRCATAAWAATSS